MHPPIGDERTQLVAIAKTSPAMPFVRQGHALTAREWEVVDLIAHGQSNREIAGELVIALSTAERHVANILNKLQLRSRVEVATWALEHQQFVQPELDVVFPRLRPLERRPHELPAPATPLIGREQELAAVAARFRSPDVRLLTLTGAGGIGKTRLALQAAAEMFDGYADGVFFVALASISEPSLVVAAIAQGLGVRDVGGNLRDSLRDFMRDKLLLLVLDNFEHLLPAASLIPALLSEAPGLNVLVTSREMLRVSGEHSMAVPPLRLPSRGVLPPLEQLTQFEAVRLFLERAQAVKSDFQVTNTNARAVVEICHQLDGLPLAIELAAARVRHLAPEALLLRLERRLAVLTGGARDQPARQQTLRDTIAWSYDLLTAEEQALFRRLAVFVGGCTLEAAEAVCVFDKASVAGVGTARSMDVFDGVASLVDKSLVRFAPRADGESRYVLLETVREYGLEQLAAAGEESATRARQAEYFESLAQRAAPHLIAAEQLTWLARIDDELDNVRVVLEWLLDHEQHERGQILAGSLWYFWSVHCRVSEGREWLTRLLADPDGHETTPRARALALLAFGLIATKQWDVVACGEAFTESLALARCAGDMWTTAMALVRSAWTAEVARNWSISPQREVAGAAENAESGLVARYEEALTIFRQLGDAWGLAQCLALYALFLVPRDAVRAQNLAREAVEIAQRLGDRWVMALSLGMLGRLAIDRGELTEARRLLQQNLPLWGELNDLYNESSHLALLAQLEMASARFADALALHERRAANFRLLGNRFMLAHALHDLAIAARLVKDADRALQAYEESVKLFQDLSHEVEVAAVRASFGHLHRQHGAFALAAVTFSESLQVLGSQDTELGIATALAGIGWIALDGGQPAEAARLLGAAEALLERMLSGPRSIAIRLQTGLRGFQFRRDTFHAAELRSAPREAFEAMGAQRFEAALDAGRVLSTAQAVALALDQAGRVAAPLCSS